MHEMALAAEMLEIIEHSARSQGFSRVRLVRLEIGQLAGVEVDAMKFCFDAAVRGSLAEGAALEVVVVAGRGWCGACRKAVPLGERFDPCPACGAYGLLVTGGTQLRVKELEVE